MNPSFFSNEQVPESIMQTSIRDACVMTLNKQSELPTPSAAVNKDGVHKLAMRAVARKNSYRS